MEGSGVSKVEIDFPSKVATVRYDAAKTTASEIVGRLQAKSKYKESSIASVVVEVEGLGAKLELTSTVEGRAAKVKVACTGEDANKPLTRIEVKLAKAPAGVKDSAPSTGEGAKMSGNSFEHSLALGDKAKGEVAVMLEVKLTAGKNTKTAHVVVPIFVS